MRQDTYVYSTGAKPLSMPRSPIERTLSTDGRAHSERDHANDKIVDHIVDRRVGAVNLLSKVLFAPLFLL